MNLTFFQESTNLHEQNQHASHTCTPLSSGTQVQPLKIIFVRMKTFIITLLYVVAIISCTKSPTNSDNISEAQLKEAQSAARDFLDVLARNDSTALIAAFSSNSEGIYAMGGEYQKIVDMIPTASVMFSGISKQTFENVSDHFLFLSPTVFIYDYKCLNKMYEKSGVVTTIDPVCCSYTFQKEKDGWKIIHAHETWMNVKVDSSMVKNK